jgi:hypothetical protein
MLDYLKQLIMGQMARSVIRSGFTFLGGALAGIGVQGEAVTQFCSAGEQVAIGVALWAIGRVWSFAEKKIAAK